MKAGETHLARRYRLERSQFIPRPRPEVFAFFANAENLERITPGFLRFRIVTPRPIPMHAGALIDYELRLYGFPIRWRTRIETFEPGSSFTDAQIRGPYRLWWHRHEFVAVEGGTQIRDIVQYELPCGWLGVAAHGLFVRRTLEQIFDRRRQAVAAVLGIP